LCKKNPCENEDKGELRGFGSSLSIKKLSYYFQITKENSPLKLYKKDLQVEEIAEEEMRKKYSK